jgi:teichuronic acid exporter
METDILAAILPVLALRILFDAIATVPGALVARRMQFRYTALRSLLANAVAAGLCVWLVLEGFALWALVLSQIANGFVAMVVSFSPHAGGRGGPCPPTALRDLRFLRPLRHGGPHPQPGAARPFASGRRSGRPDAGALLFRAPAVHDAGRADLGRVRPGDLVLMASLQERPRQRREAFRLASFASAALAFPSSAG